MSISWVRVRASTALTARLLYSSAQPSSATRHTAEKRAGPAPLPPPDKSCFSRTVLGAQRVAMPARGRRARLIRGCASAQKRGRGRS